MKAKLTQFQVENFRSIEDSGWITTEEVTCLVGTNESGKTNLLLALWKLNPANNEPIDPLIDYPRKKYHNYNNTNGNEVFIRARFKLTDEISENLAVISGWHSALMKNIEVSRYYNSNYEYKFTENRLHSISGLALQKIYQELLINFEKSELQNKESQQTLKHISEFLNDQLATILVEKEYNSADIISLKDTIENFLNESFPRKTNINNFFSNNFFNPITKIINAFEENGLQVSAEMG